MINFFYSSARGQWIRTSVVAGHSEKADMRILRVFLRCMKRPFEREVFLWSISTNMDFALCRHNLSILGMETYQKK